MALSAAGSAHCEATKIWKARLTGGGGSGWFSLRVLMATDPQLGADATEVLHKLRLLSWAFLSEELPWDGEERARFPAAVVEPPLFLSSVKQGWIISSPLITFLARQATIMIRVIESHASGIS